jgi:hypothetical protein
VVLAPRRSALDDVHRLALVLKFDSDVLAGLRRHSRFAQFSDPGQA